MVEVRVGDCVDILPLLGSGSVQCCVTSPPYWGLRDYGVNGQMGLEETPDEYIAKMVAVFREVWRVLKDDGTLFVNIGDSYAQTGTSGLKPKDLCGMPWRLAFALQDAGWYLRSDIIWAKPNPMPESVTDRPTKAHEYIFLLTKQERYYYDAEAIKEPVSPYLSNGKDAPRFRYGGWMPAERRGYNAPKGLQGMAKGDIKTENVITRNKRSVWEIVTQPFAEAHFATFPEEIPKLCILAGTKVGDTVLDPFAGSGTTGKVALELGRNAVLIELSPKYVDLIRDRTNVTPGFF